MKKHDILPFSNYRHRVQLKKQTVVVVAKSLTSSKNRCCQIPNQWRYFIKIQSLF